jgi:hypothetical protein
MAETTEELYAELADAARTLLEAQTAYKALLARAALRTEKSEGIERIKQARDRLRGLLESAPTNRQT